VASIRLALAQIDALVGDLDANVERILAAYDAAEAAGAQIVGFPELAITGYAPEDLLLKPAFVADNQAAMQRVAAATRDVVAVVGFIDEDRDLYNAAAICANGKVLATYHKRDLPNYAVFDEARYFLPGRDDVDPLELFEVGGVKVCVSICEDIWSPFGPLAEQAAGGAELCININGSPFQRGKLHARERMLATRAADASCAVAYVNRVGGQDELVFDGGSMVFDAEGDLLARSPQFAEDLLIVDVPVMSIYRKRLLDPRGRDIDAALPIIHVSDAPSGTPAPVEAKIAPHLDDVAELYEALVVGVRDYVRKNRFTDVVIGLSGGIDSTIVACIAVDALGAEHVHGVSMPSRYSSEGSKDDAAILATVLGIDYRTVAIEPAFQAYLDMLGPSFDGRPADVTEENLQSRCRGQVLMALSNKFGWMVLTTGNKSEMAVGYFTLYGDSVGGYAVIKDVFKLDVYALCRYVNDRAGREIVPEAVMTKPPSAELRPDQRDDQSLPPYEILDEILRRYIDQDLTSPEIVDAGFDKDVVARVTRLVDVNEYKRRQCPPGARVSGKAFGKDRRFPITNGYRG
jgi:NAD+ synthase (glutamine-hydrolysing)